MRALRNAEVATHRGLISRVTCTTTDLGGLLSISPGPIPPVTASEKGTTLYHIAYTSRLPSHSSQTPRPASASASHPSDIVVNQHSPTARPLGQANPDFLCYVSSQQTGRLDWQTGR